VAKFYHWKIYISIKNSNKLLNYILIKNKEELYRRLKIDFNKKKKKELYRRLKIIFNNNNKKKKLTMQFNYIY